MKRERDARARVVGDLVGDGVGREVGDLHVLEPLGELERVGQARLAEVVVEGVTLVEEVLEVVGAHHEDVVLLDRGALRLRARDEVLVGERLGRVQGLLAAPPRDVEQDAAAGHAPLRDRHDRRLVEPADGGVGVVAVPDLAVVPEVAEGVILRRSLQEGVELVVGVVQAAGVLGAACAGSPLGSPIMRCSVKTRPVLTLPIPRITSPGVR